MSVHSCVLHEFSRPDREYYAAAPAQWDAPMVSRPRRPAPSRARRKPRRSPLPFLALLLGLALFAVGYACFRSRHRELQRLLRQVQEKVLPLPPARGLLEEDYQSLVQALCRDRARLAMENENRLRDMTDYYTFWAHQIKTPIAALGLLLQETGESGPLEVELLKIEQYVEMVLSYLRLDSDSTDYVLRDCQLDEILRQAVRKLAKMFRRREKRF